jgi:stage III sporulation protein AG
MERELNDKLSALDGAGACEVIVSWESGIEAVIAYITNTSQNAVTQSPQIISSGGTQSPVILKEIYPKALGVVVFCQGAGNVRVRMDVMTAVSTLLEITPDKIQVLAMKSK